MLHSVYTDSVALNPACLGEGCIECSRLLKRHETLTFEDARIQNKLLVAMYLGDSRSVERIKEEEFAVKIWRESTYAALVKHQGAARSFSAGA